MKSMDEERGSAVFPFFLARFAREKGSFDVLAT
jgi:hypothetical protein